MSRIWKTCLFLVLLGGGKGGKIFWGLPYRFSTNPERIVKVRLQKLGFSALVFWGCIHCYHLHSAPIIQLSFIVNIVFLVCIAALHSHPAGAISLLLQLQLQLLKIQIFLLPTMLCIILFSSSISYHLDFVLNINMILATFLHCCRYWTQMILWGWVFLCLLVLEWGWTRRICTPTCWLLWRKRTLDEMSSPTSLCQRSMMQWASVHKATLSKLQVWWLQSRPATFWLSWSTRSNFPQRTASPSR